MRLLLPLLFDFINSQNVFLCSHQNRTIFISSIDKLNNKNKRKQFSFYKFYFRILCKIGLKMEGEARANFLYRKHYVREIFVFLCYFQFELKIKMIFIYKNLKRRMGFYTVLYIFRLNWCDESFTT